MKIQARIDRLIKGGATKAIVSVTLDNWYVVKGLRVVDGNRPQLNRLPHSIPSLPRRSHLPLYRQRQRPQNPSRPNRNLPQQNLLLRVLRPK